MIAHINQNFVVTCGIQSNQPFTWRGFRFVKIRICALLFKIVIGGNSDDMHLLGRRKTRESRVRGGNARMNQSTQDIQLTEFCNFRIESLFEENISTILNLILSCHVNFVRMNWRGGRLRVATESAKSKFCFPSESSYSILSHSHKLSQRTPLKFQTRTF